MQTNSKFFIVEFLSDQTIPDQLHVQYMYKAMLHNVQLYHKEMEHFHLFSDSLVSLFMELPPSNECKLKLMLRKFELFLLWVCRCQRVNLYYPQLYKCINQSYKIIKFKAWNRIANVAALVAHSIGRNLICGS